MDKRHSQFIFQIINLPYLFALHPSPRNFILSLFLIRKSIRIFMVALLTNLHYATENGFFFPRKIYSILLSWKSCFSLFKTRTYFWSRVINRCECNMQPNMHSNWTSGNILQYICVCLFQNFVHVPRDTCQLFTPSLLTSVNLSWPVYGWVVQYVILK